MTCQRSVNAGRFGVPSARYMCQHGGTQLLRDVLVRMYPDNGQHYHGYQLDTTGHCITKRAKTLALPALPALAISATESQNALPTAPCQYANSSSLLSDTPTPCPDAFQLGAKDADAEEDDAEKEGEEEKEVTEAVFAADRQRLGSDRRDTGPIPPSPPWTCHLDPRAASAAPP